MPQAVFVPARAEDLTLTFAAGVDSAPQGSLLYRSAASRYTPLVPDAAGSVLTSGGAGADPAWSTATAFLSPAVVLAPASSTRNLILASGDFVPLTIKCAPTQSADVFRITDNAGNPLFSMTGPDGSGGATVQIGTPDTSAIWAMTRTRTDLSGAGRGMLLNLTASPAANSSASFRSMFALLTSTGTVNYTGSLTAIEISAAHGSSGTCSFLRGLRPLAASSGPVTNAYGIDAQVQLSTNATTGTDLTGCNAAVSIAPSGSVATRTYCFNAAAPAVTAGASIGTNYGVRIRNQGNALITTSYAIDIDNQTNSTTPFSIRSQGGQCLFQAGTATVVPLTVQGAASQSADNFDVVNSSSVVMFGVAAGGTTTQRLIDATTAVISESLVIDHTTSGTPAAGFGQAVRFRAKSSTTASRDVARLSSSWSTATDASRKGQFRLWAADNTADREVMIGTTDGTNPMLGFLGAAAVVRQTGASAAGIAAITDASAKAAVSALQTALANLGLATAPA